MTWTSFARFVRYTFEEPTESEWKYIAALFEARGCGPATAWMLGQCDNCGDDAPDHIEGKCPFAPTTWKEISP